MRRGRPRIHSHTSFDLQQSETCDIIVTGYSENVLKIEAKSEGKIKRGFLFVPKVVEKSQSESPSPPSISFDSSETAIEVELSDPKNSDSIFSKKSVETGPTKRKFSKENRSKNLNDFEKSVEKLANEINVNGNVGNPHFETVLEVKFALKKAAISSQHLARQIGVAF
ncbi:hypothetical protein MHBO_003728 [Bonamia ostreae]|uniref:Uncharacterized protein n=1 Tax=Bonamia ostreae TaxID=126728 RepID=A0ABV2ARD5_9EUKA